MMRRSTGDLESTGPSTVSPVRAVDAESRARAAMRMVALLAWSLAAAAAYAADWESPIRVVLVLTFVLFVPGLVLGEVLNLRDAVQRLAIAVGASLALETLIAVALYYAGAFSAGRLYGAVLALTLAAMAVVVVRSPLPGGPMAETPSAQAP